MAAPQEEPSLPPTTAATLGSVNTSKVPRLFLFFNYRTVFESADIDNINFEAWKEVLDAFGYSKLEFDRFLKEFALKSPNEVMKSLCPFTTKAEWEPLLNKRDVKITREVGDLCFAEVMPIEGIKEFIIDCNKHIPTVCVLLAPFNETTSRKMLELAELGKFFDAVYGYTEREYAVLEALEVLNAPPVTIPKDVHHRWEKEGRPDQPQDVIMSFECDAFGIENCAKYDVRPIAIHENCGVDEETSATTDKVDELLSAGASLAVENYTSLKYEYLCYLK